MTSDSDASDTLPLILFSGLAADANVFIPQKLAFPQLFVPEWPTPLKGESMSAYCERIADELRSHGPCVIGGASFGGVIAQEVSEHLSAVAVILIGSIRSPTELPLYARLARPLRFLVPLIPVRLLQLLVAPAASPLAQKIAPHWGGMARQFRNSSPQVFKWSLRRILDWRKRAEPNCPVFHIHGRRDWVLPVRRTNPDRVVASGGHVISLTHPREVNEYIRDVLDQIEAGQYNTT